MAIKGFKRTRTKAQDLTEIVYKQDGFLTGLNLDAPKSDVGNTQLTVAKNVIPYRDRVEARGGIKPLMGYKYEDDATESPIEMNQGSPAMYDADFDAFFLASGSGANYDKEGYTTRKCYDYTINSFGDQERIGDGLFFSSIESYANSPDDIHNNFIEKHDGSYFMRPLSSDTTSTAKINVYPGSPSYPESPGEFEYGFITTFVRIVDSAVVAESKAIGKANLSYSTELDGTVKPFSLYREPNLYPQDYYDTSKTGTDNFYTHIRYYRTKVNESSSNLDDFYSVPAYYVADYDINAADLLPGPELGPTLDLNITDDELTSDSSRAVLWQGGYQQIRGTLISCSSSGFFLCRNERKKNEFIYCPVGSGDNRKYLGWYNPLLQYGSVDGDITQILDMGSYALITTKNNTYYVDTVNYIEDETQKDARIFTPILPSSVLISDRIGIAFDNRDAFVKTSTGSAIGITSTGEIREFKGYQWGADLALNKVHSITKTIKTSYCHAVFVNDAYYFAFGNRTFRLGTTEESGFGFSEFDGEGWSLEPRFYNTIGSLYNSRWFYNVNGVLCFGRFEMTNPQTLAGYNFMYEYTGDNFDKKLSKDVVDNYDGSPRVYVDTSYYDIPVEIEFPEATGSSESYFLYFLKANYYLRADRYSYKVDESVPGYEIEDTDLTSISLSDITFGMDCRVGESEDIVASNDGFQPTSAVTMQREVQDHRVRMSLRASGGGFQLTGMEAHFKRHDRTELSPTETTNSIQYLNTGLFCHIDEKFQNLAIGSTTGSSFGVGAPTVGARVGSSAEGRLIDGATLSIVEGPNGSNNGIEINGVAEFSVPRIEQGRDINGQESYCVMFWTKRDTDGSVYVSKTTSYGDMFTVLSTSKWTHFCYYIRYAEMGSYRFEYYVDGVLSGTGIWGYRNYLNSHYLTNSVTLDNVTLADVRMYGNKFFSEERLSLYIDNYLNNNGDYFNGY